MTIFGKSVSDYYKFQRVILGLILLVGIGRLALSLAGLPNSSAKWLSITTMLGIGMVYCSIRMARSGFGSYKHLLPVVGMQTILTQAIIVAAIALAIFTSQDNIYTAPEYSGGGDGKNWTHAGAHLLFGTIVLTLINWLIGSIIMFVTKKAASGRGQTTPSASDKGKAAAAGVK